MELLISSVVISFPPGREASSGSISRTFILLDAKDDERPADGRARSASLVGSLIDAEPPGLLLGVRQFPGPSLLLAMTNRRLSPTAASLGGRTGYDTAPGGVAQLSIDDMLEFHIVDAVLLLSILFFSIGSTTGPSSSAAS